MKKLFFVAMLGLAIGLFSSCEKGNYSQFRLYFGAPLRSLNTHRGLIE